MDVTKETTIISELVKSSVRHFLVAPGSRSTPLVLAAANEPLTETFVHYDERGLAFHAFGLAKATNLPTCLICTSGTALMNFYPAVVEASMAQIPLIILAADRPPELRDTGANQSIDQVNVFGRYLRWEIDLATQDSGLSNHAIATSINQAVYRSLRAPRGPVLINCMFREPFSLEKPPSREHNPFPKTKYYHFDKELDIDHLQYLASELSQYEKGLIVVGARERTDLDESILATGMKLQWPIFADPISGLREMGCDSCMIPFYNHVLQTTHSKEKMVPDVVLHFGGQIVSKVLLMWLKTLAPKKYFLVANFPNRHDPHHQVTDKIEIDPARFCSKLSPYIKGRSPSPWLNLWKEYSRSVESGLIPLLKMGDKLSEPFAVHTLLENVPRAAAFFFGTSLPIRYADSFFFPQHPTPTIFANRGASGLDGLISTCIGIARGLKQPLVAVLGDQGFLHDLNSLGMLHKRPLPITFVLLNNSGGGIFHALPIAEHKAIFEEFFLAKHTLTFEKFAEGFHIPYFCPSTPTEFLTLLKDCTKTHTPNIIEVQTSSQENHDLLLEIEKKLKSQLIGDRKKLFMSKKVQV